MTPTHRMALSVMLLFILASVKHGEAPAWAMIIFLFWFLVFVFWKGR